jgi:hypothetical protein
MKCKGASAFFLTCLNCVNMVKRWIVYYLWWTSARLRIYLYLGYSLQGRIHDFKLGGAYLKKLRRAEGGANIFGVFRVKNHDFTTTYYSNFMGGSARRVPPPPWIRPCVKSVEPNNNKSVFKLIGKLMVWIYLSLVALWREHSSKWAVVSVAPHWQNGEFTMFYLRNKWWLRERATLHTQPSV